MAKPLPFGEIKLASLQLLGASAELFFGSLAVLNVNTRSIPLDNVAVLVAHGYFVVQHPAIFAVRPPDACFMQEGFTTGQGRAPLLNDSFDIVGMNARRPFPALQLFQRPTYILQPSLIEEIEVAVGQTGVNQAGGRIDQELKVRESPLLPLSGFWKWSRYTDRPNLH